MSNSNAYDSQAERYSNLIDSLDPDYIRISHRHLPEDLSGKKALDLGCGAGHDLEWMHERGAEVYGVDTSECLMKIARERVPSAEIRFNNFLFLPFQRAFFDVVHSRWALQATADLSSVYESVAHVLKPGGIFFALVTHPLRQFMEKRAVEKDYFAKEIVRSTFFFGDISVMEPTHTLQDYLSAKFFRYFDLLAFEEGDDESAGIEMVDRCQYPVYMILKARRKQT